MLKFSIPKLMLSKMAVTKNDCYQKIIVTQNLLLTKMDVTQNVSDVKWPLLEMAGQNGRY